MKWVVFILFVALLCISLHAKNYCNSKNEKSIYNPSSNPPPYLHENKHIKYYIEKTKLTNQVIEYLNFFENKTCLKFLRLKNELKNSIGINFYITKKGSRVNLSHKKNYPTNVYLNENLTSIRHLLRFFVGLSLGLLPEWRRKDRNEYVKILFGNISSAYQVYYKIQFKYHESYYNTGFDISSNMLLNPTFGLRKSGNHTYMSKLYPYYEKSLQLFNYYSFNDAKRVNNLYCGNVCNKPNYCLNGGYLAKDCGKCKCFFPFTTNQCQLYVKRNKNCGKKDAYYSSSKLQTETISNISGRCYYSVISQNKKKIKFTLLKLKLKTSGKFDSSYCVEIKYQKDKGAQGLTLCEHTGKIEFPALSDEIIIIFNSHDFNNEIKFSYQEVSKS